MPTILVWFYEIASQVTFEIKNNKTKYKRNFLNVE